MLQSATKFECIALAPCDPGPPRIAVAASRAGGIGVLDIEFARQDSDVRSRILGRVRWLCDRIGPDGRVGLRLPVASLPLYSFLIDSLPEYRSTVILTAPAGPAEVEKLRAGGRRQVLVEVRSLTEYLQACECGADGAIACGHETGGSVAGETTFVLLQKLLRHSGVPVWARGGIGIYTAAGCRAAGARGVVLDDQLLLTPESPLPESWKEALAGLTGQETAVLGEHTGLPCRVLDRPAFAGAAKLKDAARHSRAEWEKALAANVAWAAPGEAAWPLGQAVGLAEPYRKRFGTTERIVRAVLEESARCIKLARERRPLAAGSPLARAQGTEYPVAQGPMARISDRPEFALTVAEGGGLPFLALASLRGAEIGPMLEQTHSLLGDRPWGVGLLGFLNRELSEEQIREVMRVRPRFALISGSSGEMAKALETAGIATYQHAPSPGALRSFLAQGLRRFIFEGRECGGHVGPLCSFPLWEMAIGMLLDGEAGSVEGMQVLFAGGIHDAVSGSMVAAMAAPLAERGVDFGVLIGTAYLFTEEAVETGAILPRYQQTALACRETVLLTAGPGQSIRVAPTRFAAEFEQKRAEEDPAGSVKSVLDNLMLGRLRLAAKGLLRDGVGNLVTATDDRQAEGGAYVVGQVAALRSSVCRIADLHKEICENEPCAEAEGMAERSEDTDGVAVIGIATLVPGARTAGEFWRNILNNTVSIEEVPASRWDVARSYDPDRTAPDKTNSKWGGFIRKIPFDPLHYRIPPSVLPSISTAQLLALETTRRALADAGYLERGFDRQNTAVVFGTAAGGPLGDQLCTRTMLPLLTGSGNGEVPDMLPGWTAESFPGILSNVIAGRIANHFDLGGPNFAVDAACASSLMAVDVAARELQSGRSSMAIAGGVDTTQTPFSYVAFSKTGALSPQGRARVFDKSADGIVISEGVSVLILKRLADARRDGDRVYAIIRGTGASSDGKGQGLTVPRVEGQTRAIRRALRDAGVPGETIGLYEAHGTGTQVGDRTELETLTRILKEANARPASCAVGSVKSLIGHTKAAAGVNGLVKAVLALHHGVLPPHAGVSDPIDPLVQPDAAIYTLQQPRPWLANPAHPRRAGVSAFGFGGANSHAIVESAEDGLAAVGAPDWPCELLLFAGRNEEELLAQMRSLGATIEQGGQARLCDIAYALARAAEAGPPGPRLAIVAADLEELSRALAYGRELIQAGPRQPGLSVFYQPAGAPPVGRVAFMFPGQGAQYPNMALEHALYFRELREALEFADETLRPQYDGPLSSRIFPPAAFDAPSEQRQRQALADTHCAQPAIGAISLGLLEVMENLGARPDMAGGHSYGELSALCAAGALSRRSLVELSEIRGRAMAGCCGDGGMIAVRAPRERVAAMIAGVSGVVVANHNGLLQTILSGSSEGLRQAGAMFADAGVQVSILPVAGPFHSPLMAPALETWKEAVAECEIRESRMPVYRNADGQPYPVEPAGVRDALQGQLLHPVEFLTQVKQMYADGARTFIEVGPGSVLTHLISAILGDSEHFCVSLDPERGHLRGFLSAIGMLAVRGAIQWPAKLFAGRVERKLRLETLAEEMRAPAAASAWWVDGNAVWPQSQDAPQRPAQSRAASRRASGIPPVPPEPVAPTAAPSAVLAAYMAYQETMHRFLALQEEALTGYLAFANGTKPAMAAAQALARAAGPSPAAVSEAALPNPPERPPQAEGPPHGGPADREFLTRELLSVVAEHTGYPKETLSLNLGLEADLGVDSLRRMEILDALHERLHGTDCEWPSGISQAESLGQIVDMLAGTGQVKAPAPPMEIAAESTCPRLVPRGIEQPLPGSGAAPLAGTVLLVEDELGVAGIVARELSGEHTAVTCITREQAADPEVLRERLRDLPLDLSAVVHLGALSRTPVPERFEDWRRLVQVQAKSLFQILSVAAPRLSGGSTPRPRVFAATLLGGTFGRSGASMSGLPAGGACVGLLKSVAQEWPGTAVRAVDFDDSLTPRQMAGIVVQELHHPDSQTEVGYPGGTRTAFDPVAESVRKDGSPRVAPAADWVVLVTGGARGITAEILRTLAQPGMTVVIIGQSAAPAKEDEFSAFEDANALRSHLSKAAEPGAAPAKVEARVQRILRCRERRRNLDRLRESGVDAVYRQCDVRDPEALSSAIEDVYARYGRLDCVIHGAGIIEDKLLEKKEWDSFDRVFDTKVNSTYVLSQALRPEGLKLVVLFGSVVAGWGNAGQADYAAANAVLNRFGWWLATRWPAARVVTINWGPWAASGMASEAVRARLRARGIVSIEPSDARAFFTDEIAWGRRQDVELVVGKGPWSAPVPAAEPGPVRHATPGANGKALLAAY